MQELKKWATSHLVALRLTRRLTERQDYATSAGVGAGSAA
jgi:hypothetical protein